MMSWTYTKFQTRALHYGDHRIYFGHYGDHRIYFGHYPMPASSRGGSGKCPGLAASTRALFSAESRMFALKVHWTLPLGTQ